MKQHIKRYTYRLWLILVSLVVTAAIAVSLLNELVPYINRHHDNVVGLASEVIGLPVSAKKITAHWQGIHPALSFQDLQVLSGHHQQPVATIKRLDITFNIIASLLHLSLQSREISISSGQINKFALRPSLTDNQLSPGPLMAFLLKHKRLTVKDSVIIIPHKTGKAIKLKVDNLHLWQRRFKTNAFASLSLNGAPLKIKALMAGDHLDNLSGQLYLEGRQLALDKLLTKPIAGVLLKKATADGKVWLNWRHGAIISFTYQGAINQLIASHSHFKALEQLKSLSGVIHASKKEKGWLINAKQLQLKQQGKKALPLNFSLQTDFAEHAILRVKNFNLKNRHYFDDLIKNNGLATPFLKQVTGHLRQLDITLQPQGRYKLSARFAEAVVNDLFHLKKASHLKGQLEFADKAWRIFLNSPNTTIKTAFIKKPITKTSVKGYLVYRPTTAHDIEGTDFTLKLPEGQLRADFRLNVRRPATPHLALVATLDKISVQSAKTYLPASQITPPLSHWLKTALQDGKITKTALLFHGPITKFPFQANEGYFKTQFFVDDLSLAYHRLWPQIKAIKATVSFENASFGAKVQQAKMAKSIISNTTVIIPRLDKNAAAILKVAGTVNATMQAGKAFIKSTPLKASVGRVILPLAATGPLDLDLKFSIPLSKSTEQTQVKGTIHLNDNTFILPTVKQAFTNLKGPLQFAGKKIFSPGIVGQFLGAPAKVTIAHHTKQEKVSTVFNLTSQISPSALNQQILKKVLPKPVPYTANFELFSAQKARLNLQFPLTNIPILLPAPLGKKAAAQKALRAQIDWQDINKPLMAVSAHYGDKISAVFALNHKNGHLFLDKGLVVLDGKAQKYRLPKTGIKVRGPHNSFDVNQWLSYADDQPSLSQKNYFKYFDELDLKFKQLKFHGFVFNRPTIRVAPSVPFWLFNIDSDNFTGRVWWPQDFSKNKLFIDLAQCDDLLTFNKKGAKQFQLTQFPALDAKCKNFRLDDINFGTLAFSLRPNKDTVYIDKLQLQGIQYELMAKGLFSPAATHIDGRVIAPDIGSALKHLGFKSNIVNMHGRVNFQLNWDGPIYHFSLGRLKGLVNLRFKGGHLLGVEPGIGRLLTALSLESINRRFQLGLKDFFEKGLAVDSVKADFTLKDGRATTPQMQLEGPSASIMLQGYTDLVEKTYNFQAKVTPHITSSLPLAAAVAAANPAVGAAVWLVDKVILRPEISRMTRYHYQVTGDWHKPQITLINEEKR